MKRILATSGAVLLTICGVFAQNVAVHPKTFDSPDAAAKALIEASAKNDASELTAVLGSASKGILTSGDVAQDQQERAEFSKLAATKNHIERSSMDSNLAVLLVGSEDWPFPIPLVRKGQEWHFDPELGGIEIQARKIGADELDAIEISMGYVGAQEAYAAASGSGRAYARNIGGKDGLYQPGKNPELVPEGFAGADAGSSSKKPYHGYYFRVLTGQGPNAPGGPHRYIVGNTMIGGFGLIAWPAEYGVTGIHTFTVNQDGQVFEKDFGPRTTTLAGPLTIYDPDSSWTPVD
jgi:hypothetical protein